MNTKTFALGVVLAATTAFGISTSALLMGDSTTAGKKAIIGDLSVSAASIAVDPTTNQLRCSGPVELRYGSTLVHARDCVIELGRDTSVYCLNPRGVEVHPAATGSAAAKPDTAVLNQALRLTPGIAAPAAPQSGRQP